MLCRLLENPIKYWVSQAEHVEREHLTVSRLFASFFLEEKNITSVIIFSDEVHLLVCGRLGRAQAELRLCQG